MALKLAILRTNDTTGDIDQVYLELDLRAELVAELAAIEARVLLKKRFGPTAADHAVAALDRVEKRLKASTVSIP